MAQSNRIMNAKKEYQAKNWKPTEAAFYATDLHEVYENGGGYCLGHDHNSTGSRIHDRIPQGQERQQEEDAADMIFAFEQWSDMLIDGSMPRPQRFEKEVLNFYKGFLSGTDAPFYWMFLGFVGGIDFLNGLMQKIENNKHEKRHEAEKITPPDGEPIEKGNTCGQ